MEKKELVLRVGDYPGAHFDDVVNLVIAHNTSIGKAHFVANRNKQRVALICSQRTACAFRVNIRALSSVEGVRITTFSGHSCVGGSSRLRQFSKKVLARRAPVMTDFIATKGRVSGNAAQLTEMVRKQCGIALKPTQAHSIVAAKQGTDLHHLAQIRVLRSYLAAVPQRDPGGMYALATTPVPGTTQQQLHSVFCCPKGAMDTWAAFDGFVSVDAAHLTSVTQGQLFTLTTYDSNRHATTLAFCIAQRESALSCASFLSNCISCFPNISILMSDGAKGLDSAEVSELLSSHNVTRSRCAWHLLWKNLRAAGIKHSYADRAALWSIVYARTENYAYQLLEQLKADNEPLVQWFSERMHTCATFEFLKRGLSRLGVASSNSAEQTNSALVKVRAEPICDIVASIIGRMSDDRFKRGRMAHKMISTGKLLTPYCYKKHQEKIIRAQKLLVEPEVIESDMLRCVVSSDVTPFHVVVTSEYRAACSCRHFEEHQRPCSHVVAALLFASRRLARHRVAFDPWNKNWFGDAWLLRTWAKQHEGSITRVAVTGDQLVQEDLLPFDLVAKPGRKRKRPYIPSEMRARHCSSCGNIGHFSRTCAKPNIHNVVEAKREQIDKAAQSMIIDLTAGDDGDATWDEEQKPRE